MILKGLWALARFCAPWVPDAGEKEKNALPRQRKAFALRRFGTSPESGASQGILFLLARQLIAVQKACQSPHTLARCHPGFPHRCAIKFQCYGWGVPAARLGKSQAPSTKPKDQTSPDPAVSLSVWDLGFGIWFLFGACDL